MSKAFTSLLNSEIIKFYGKNIFIEAKNQINSLKNKTLILNITLYDLNEYLRENSKTLPQII